MTVFQFNACVVPISAVLVTLLLKLNYVKLSVTLIFHPIFIDLNLQFTSSTLKCPLCSFDRIKLNSDSTPSDFVLGYLGGSGPNAYSGVFVHFRTFRTTQSKSHYVVFVQDDMVAFTQLPFFSHCGITVAPVKHIPSKNGILRYHNKVRFLYFYEFLLHYKPLIFRVLITDITDVVFQGDPFTRFIRADTLYILDQRLIAHSSDDYEWINLSILPEDRPFFTENVSVYNSGSIIGGVNNFLDFFPELIRRILIPEMWPQNSDQAIFEIMVYNGYIQNHTQVIIYHNHVFPFAWIAPYCHMFQSPKEKFGHYKVNEGGPYKGTKFLYFHGYYTCTKMVKELLNLCPPIHEKDVIREVRKEWSEENYQIPAKTIE